MATPLDLGKQVSQQGIEGNFLAGELAIQG